jgi:hypothetical protein
MIKLLVGGDSWTSCWPLEQRLGHRNFGWPNLVAQHFNFDLIDKSRAGSSNFRIYRKAFDGMLSGKCDLVIVFLTSWTRFETGATYGDKPGRIYQHMPMQKASNNAFRLLFNGYKNYSDMLRQIIGLQSLSNTIDVPCYFLDTYENNLHLDISLEDFKQILSYNQLEIDNMNDERILDKLNTIKMLESNIDFEKFISLESYQSQISEFGLDDGHPLADGHKKISDVVIKFLERKYHGQSF